MSRTEQHNRIDYIEFPVSTVGALLHTQAFFKTVFGWEYKAWGDTYADTQSSGLASGISSNDDVTPGRPLPVVYVSDLEALLERIRATGVEITQPITAFPGGRRFHFKEPSGNELAAWSDRPGPDSE